MDESERLKAWLAKAETTPRPDPVEDVSSARAMRRHLDQLHIAHAKLKERKR